MGRSSVPKLSFTSGELSPRLLARDDLAQYNSGCATLQNFTVTPHGAAVTRGGTRFIAAAKNAATAVRLIPFEYSTEQTYVIELGGNYARFFSRGAQVLSSGAPVEIATPWSATEVWGVSYAQSADVLYLVHPDHPVYKITRTDATTFTISEVAWSAGRAPLGVFNVNIDCYVATNVAGVDAAHRVITMSAPTFTSSDIGRVMYVRDVTNSVAVYYEIESLSVSAPTTTATVSIKHAVIPAGKDHPSGPKADRWALGVFSSTEGCRAVAFVEGRLALGGFRRFPDMFWLSASDDFENFEIESPDPDALDAENASRAIQRRLLGGQVNTILWLADSGSRVTIGTSGASFSLSSASEGVLTPTGATVRKLSSRGASAIRPIVVEADPVFATRNGASLRALTYSLEDDAVVSEPITIACEHLYRSQGGINELAYQQEPDSVIWAAVGSGGLVGLTYERGQKVVAGHRHVLGGSYQGGDPVVESLVVLSGAAASREVTVETGASNVNAPLVNPGAEAGTLAGWTSTGSWTVTETGGGLIPHGGSYFFACTSAGILRQSVNLEDVPGINLRLVDEGLTSARVEIAVGRAAGTEELNATVEAISATGTVLAVLYDLEDFSVVPPAGGAWSAVGGTFVLPRATRALRVTLTGTPDTYFDATSINIDQGSQVNGGGAIGQQDQVWLLVKRTINGVTVRYVEAISPAVPGTLGLRATDTERRDALDAACCLDASLIYANPVSITNVVPDVGGAIVVSPVHGLDTGDKVRLRGVRGDLSNLNYTTFRVERLDEDRFRLFDPVTGAPIKVSGDFLIADAVFDKAVETISGLDHLEGEVVSVVGDGSFLGKAVVEHGSVTLPVAATRAVVGLPYTCTLETMPLVGVSQLGGSQRSARRVPRIGIRLLDTVGGRVGVGPNPARWERIESGRFQDPVQSGPLPRTVQVTGTTAGGWGTMPTVVIQQPDPLPMGVLAIYPEVDFDEG